MAEQVLQVRYVGLFLHLELCILNTSPANKTHDHCEVLATYKQSSGNFQSRVSFQAGTAATFIIGAFH